MKLPMTTQHSVYEGRNEQTNEPTYERMNGRPTMLLSMSLVMPLCITFLIVRHIYETNIYIYLRAN